MRSSTKARPSGRIDLPLFLGLMAIVLAFQAATIWCIEWLPFQDLGGHLQLMDVMARFNDPATSYSSYFSLPAATDPNTIALHVARLLGSWFSALTIAKLLLTFYVVALPLSISALCVSFGRSKWLGFLAGPMTFNAVLDIGFLNYLIAMPLLFWAIALSRTFAVKGGLWRGGLLAFLGVGLFYSHVIAYLIGLGICMTLLTLFFSRWRGLLRLLPPLVPFPLFFGWFMRKTVSQEATASGRTLGSADDAYGAVFREVDKTLSDFHNWGMQFFRGNADDITFVLLASVWLMFMCVGSNQRPSPAERETQTGAAKPLAAVRRHLSTFVRTLRHYALEGIVLCCVFACFILPVNIQEVDVISQRIIVLTMLLMIALPRIPIHGPQPRVLIIAAICIAAIYPWTVREELIEFDREMVGSLPETIASLPDGSVLWYVPLTRRSEFTHKGAHWHFPRAIHSIENGGLSNDTFAIRPTSPVQYLDGTDVPPRSTRYWSRQHLRQYDYLLLQSPGRPGRIARAPLDLIFQEGPWWLYEVTLVGEHRSGGRNIVEPGVLVGGTGGHSDRFECPAGTVMGGLDVSVTPEPAAYIAALAPRCRNTSGEAPSEAATVWLGEPDNGQVRALECDDGQVVVGFRGRAAAWIDRIAVVCGPAGPALANADAGSYESPEFAGGPGGFGFETVCPQRPASGVIGQFGQLVDGLGLLCTPDP